MRVKEISVVGEKQDHPASTTTHPLKLETTYSISGITRDKQTTHRIDLEQEDKILEFVFEDETKWICDGQNLHELFPESEEPNRSIEEPFFIPLSLQTIESERGIFGGIALKLINVFKKEAIATGVKTVAQKLEDKLMEKGEGLFQLSPDFALMPLGIIDERLPILILIHGTNSNIVSAFSELKKSDVWPFIHSTYQNNVLAFQHRTLSETPLENAFQLLKNLPKHADLHLISHSRGGLIGEILCRYSTNEDNRLVSGFTDDNIALLAKEGRDNDILCIQALKELALTKAIQVKKFIRIACPAAGTRLASKRLDNIFNVLFNLLGSHLNPVADIFKELIAETLKTKDNVNVLPGLEAQSPDSLFIKILNDRSEDVAIDGRSLAVISGNGKWSVSLGGLKVIVGKLFYGQRNDLVVNTDSMYLGAHRKGVINYFFDQGAGVDHHRYFLNPKTREAISFALQAVDGTPIPGFTQVGQYEVPSSDRDLRGFEHGELFPYPNVPTGKRPIVVLLPGIMGSNIAQNGNRLWLAYLRSIFGGLTDLQALGDKTITANSLIKTSYKQLADRLSYTYDVVIQPFDWRKQLNECAQEFNATVLELLKYERPIKIIGHSMGGVLVRDFILQHADTWRKLNATKDFRLLFLGSPLGGSFRILTVLFGDDTIINSLNMLDRRHTKKELLYMFCKFPGILSLLPLTTEEKYDFADTDTWKKMTAALGDSTWPIPSPKELKEFKAYRDGILNTRDSIDYSNMVYIAGKDKYTPCDYYNDMIGPRTELVFLATEEGDQSVTWASGIPQEMVEAKSVYYSKVTHGALANAPEIFDAIEDILKSGKTDDLPNSKPISRGDSRLFRLPTVYNFDLSERGIENAVFGITKKGEPPVSQIPISISVSNGDLAYASFPVLAGHFTNDSILYAEKAIDKQVNESLSARHRLGIYPGAVGTSTVVLGKGDRGDFPGAIIVGLGEPGNLTSYQLSRTVEQGISSYLLHVNSRSSSQTTNKEIGISAVSIANGYGGLSTESSLKAIIEGVNNGNTNVKKVHGNDTKTIQYIEFIEVYEDRALNCLYILRKIESKENRMYNIKMGNKTLKKLFGVKKRLPVEMSEDWWNRITIKCKKQVDGGEEVSSLVFSASTGDAREEENELFSSTPLIDLFIEQISTANRWEVGSAKTLFELMIPAAFKDRLKRKGNVSWILDEDTAGYPWELLQDSLTNAKPFCVNSGMIRQLSTNNYSPNIKRVATDMALIIADPQLDGFATQLKGAREEGETVEKKLTANGYSNLALINKTAGEITSAFFQNDYKIVHLAGHGIYKPNARLMNKSGMLIGNNVFFGTAQIAQLPSIPELVFVNCCHLGRQSGEDERFFQNRYKLAANISTQLIKMGVKAVVAAGWAVDDSAAVKFSDIFYSKMLEGYYFGDAVREARSEIYDQYHQRNNTWGAYQCYGDPFYKLINRSTSRKEPHPSYVIEEEVKIDLGNLLNDLDTRNISSKEAIDKLSLITQGAKKAEIHCAEISELEALIFFELSEYEQAAEKYGQLLKENQAKFSVSAMEKYCNVQIKQFALVHKTIEDKTLSSTAIEGVITNLKKILEINETAERLCLMGSAYKRKAFVTPNLNKKLEAYREATAYYKKAYEDFSSSYALQNWIVLQSALGYGEGEIANNFKSQEKKELQERVKERKRALRSSYTSMNYWEIVEDLGYDLSLLLLDGQNVKADDRWKDLITKYKILWNKAGSKGKRRAEIENFEIISDVFGISTTASANFFKEKITEIKTLLEKALEV